MPLNEKQEALTEFTQYSFPTFYVKNNCNRISDTLKKKKKKKDIGLKKNHLTDRRIIKVPIVESVIDNGFPADDKNTNRYQR